MTLIKTDEEIKRDIMAHLRGDDRLLESGIEVSVERGRVTLTGEATNIPALHIAEGDAWSVSGVIHVDNRLVLASQGEGEEETDLDLENKILKVLEWNADMDPSTMEISARRGSVTLEGSVTSYWKKLYAEEIVGKVRGVLEVMNKLIVVPSKTDVDESIAEEIASAFERNAAIDRHRIDIQVEDGKVHLSGKAKDWIERHAAFFTAVYTKGVRDIENHIEIDRSLH